MQDYESIIQQRQGTSFKGYILATYEQLIGALGQPSRHGDGYKTDVEWVLSTPCGPATIYNYKNGKAYLCERGIEVRAICEWHVSGKNMKSYEWVKAKIEKSIINQL